jgi:hypothetical protein
MKTRLLVAALTILCALVPSRAAEATVEGYAMYNVPYQHRQTSDICFMRLPVLASFGIPQAVLAQASLAPTQVLKDYPSRSYVNINLASPARPMVHTYLSDGVTVSGVWEYSMKLDVTALAAYNGTTVAGRQATIRSAKLALLAMARNMEDLSHGNYRLRVTFVGLPSQTGLTGTKLYASTLYAYTVESPLIQAYENELLNRGGSCNLDWEH